MLQFLNIGRFVCRFIKILALNFENETSILITTLL